MRISSGRKTLMLVSILVISGAAFVYFDPLGLDLLGLQQHAVVMKAVPAPHPAAPASKPAVVPAHVAAASSAASSGVGASQQMNAVHPPVIAQHADVPAATPLTAAPVASATASAEVAQPPAQPAAPARPAKKAAPAKPKIPRDADLRHCLDLESDAAIAKCAGE